MTATIRVDHTTAPALNFGEDTLSDIVVLSILGGRDIFLSISAREYIPTCFANSLTRLVHLEQPIRSYPTQTLEQLALSLAGDDPPEATLSIPKELERMIAFLIAHNGLLEVRSLQRVNIMRLLTFASFL